MPRKLLLFLCIASIAICQSQKEDVFKRVVEMHNRTSALYKQGKYAEAKSLAEDALQLSENELGPNHPSTATSLNNLAFLYTSQGDYAKSLPLNERALAIRESAFGPNHPAVAESLSNLSELYRHQAEYAKATPLCERALKIREATLGPKHPDTALSVNNLAVLYESQGDYAKALPLYERALAIKLAALKPDDPSIATTLNNMALLYKRQGEYTRSLILYELAFKIHQANRPNSPEVALSIDNIAGVLEAMGQYDKALLLRQGALHILEASLGPNHVDVATSVSNLAGVYQLKRNYAKAIPLYERSLKIWESTQSPNHPDVAIALDNLASAYHAQGEYGKALPLRERATQIAESALGSTHPRTILIRRGLASTLVAMGTASEAENQLELIVHSETAALRSQTAVGTTSQRKTSILQQWSALELLIEAYEKLPALRPKIPPLLLETALNSRGRLTTEMRESLRALKQRSGTEERKLLEDYDSLIGRIVRAYDNPAPKQRLDTLYASLDRTIAHLGERSLQFRQLTQIPSRAEVARALQKYPGTAIVELMRLGSVKAFQGQRYFALVMTPDGALDLLDLGDAKAMDELAGAYRLGLTVQGNEAYLGELQYDLYDRLMHPILARLPNVKRWFLLPDGALVRVPFDTLLKGAPVQVTYLGSALDLVNRPMQKTDSSANAEVAFVNPLFGTAEAGQAARFSPLGMTNAEASELKKIWPAIQTFTGADATKDRLKKLPNPRFLHLSTHGFFDEQNPGTDPLLRAGIALAGANRSPDGIATAMELIGLDLRGTQLVVLSACETGLGDYRYYEGILGLQRSFTLAGAQSMLLSLWKVEPKATLELTLEFYRQLKAGKSKAQALSLAKQKLRDAKYPIRDWAAFVLYGNPSPLAKQ